MATLRTIKLKRTDLGTHSWSELKLKLAYGEPLWVKKSGEFYLTAGTNPSSNVEAGGLPKIKAIDEDIVDQGIFYVNEGFDASRVGDIRNTMDDTQTKYYPMTIDAAVICKKNSSSSSYDTTRTLAEKLARIDSLLGDVNEGAGTIGTQTGNHEGRMDSIETLLGINGHPAGPGVKYVDSTLGTGNNKYYLTGVKSEGSQIYNARPTSRTLSSEGVYWKGDTGALYGSAWNNDYAEARELLNWSNDITIEAGTCVVETGNGKVAISNEDLLPCAYIVSDTYGMLIGPDDQTPVAVAGRVLAKVEFDKYELGDCLCTTKYGMLRKMTRREVRRYPDRIVGTVCEIPTYTEWHGRNVNGRIWIKIK